MHQKNIKILDPSFLFQFDHQYEQQKWRKYSIS